MSKFIAVDGTKVLGVFSGEKFGDGRNCIDVPDDSPVQAGQDVGEFDKDWTLLPLSTRVESGFVKIDAHFEVQNEAIVQKSQVKCILEGIEEIPAGYKMVAEADAPAGFGAVDGYAIIPLSPYELMFAGKIDRPAGQKIIEDPAIYGGYRLEPMTTEERIAAGELTAEDVAQAVKNAEVMALLRYLEESKWYADRSSDYLATNGKYGKLIPDEIAAQRQTARARISELRQEP